jgi:hypothetical protein
MLTGLLIVNTSWLNFLTDSQSYFFFFQGLSDPEEFVVSRCIGAMASLTELDLLQKAALYELLKDTTPYLLHPNLWIRQATAGNLNNPPGDSYYF